MGLLGHSSANAGSAWKQVHAATVNAASLKDEVNAVS
jgi:hypothetical protein